MRNPKIAIGVALVAGSALVSTPLMSRYWSDEQLTLVSVALLAHSLLGAIDLFRPVIVRRVSFNRSFGTAPNLLFPSVASTFVIALLILVVGMISADRKFHALIVSICATIVIYGFYSPFWGLLDGTLRMAETYLVRSSSVALLYLALGFGALVGWDGIIYSALVGVNALTAFIFWVKAKGELAPGGLSLDRAYLVEGAHILVQNTARLVNDFGDRVVSALFLPIGSAGGYILLSDFASRANFLSQLFSAYLYPVLCHDLGKAKAFLFLGLSISTCIIASSVALYFFGFDLFTMYFGDARAEMFWVFCCLLACFGIYALSFFGQAVLRSHSLDRSLSISLLLPAVGAVVFLLGSMDGLSVAEVVALALLSKASAVFMLLRLFPLYRLPSACGLIVCAIGVGFVTWILWG